MTNRWWRKVGRVTKSNEKADERGGGAKERNGRVNRKIEGIFYLRDGKGNL